LGETDGLEVTEGDKTILISIYKGKEGIELFITYIDVTFVKVFVKRDTIDDTSF
jgi:hypothetical protein